MSTRRNTLTAALGLAVACLGVVPAAAHRGVEEEIAEATSRIAAQPHDASLYLRRGDLHRIHRNWPHALADFAHARRLDPKLHRVDFFVGRTRVEAGQPQLALPALDRFLTEEPDDPAGFACRARAHARLGDALAAAADFDRSIALQIRRGRGPTPEIFLERSRTLQAAGGEHLSRALQGIEQGLDRLKHPVVLELEALELEARVGLTDDALARIERLASTSARPEPWLVRRGEILERAGRRAESYRAYLAARDALAALPEPRRRVPALARLQHEVQQALERLGQPPAPSLADEVRD